jgi:Fe-S-cluster containining protein
MRFECQSGCNACCEQTGYVYLAESDIPRIAAFLDLSTGEFEERHVERNKHWTWLRTPLEGSCVFLAEGRCSIHEVKPLQCRAFPFWPELLESRQQWRETAAMCPGIGKGELVQMEAAKAIAQEVRAAYPSFYKLVTISSAAVSKNK